MPRDRLRELLDAVLDEQNGSLAEMADGAFASPFHFGRLVARGSGESPMAMRRRVMLERAAWQLAQGLTVTDAAWAAGYSSVEGFSRAYSRAFGHPPSSPASRHWLPAPNGIHFHPPMSLWVQAKEQAMNPVVSQLVAHDLDDTEALLDLVATLPDDVLRAPRRCGGTVTEWEGSEESIRDVLEHHVYTKEVWLAAIDGADDVPRPADEGLAGLRARHAAVAPRWLAFVQELERRGGWDDRLIDALCEPPESFVMSSVVAHVLIFAAHRRQLVRRMLAEAGTTTDSGDPILWFRARRGEE
jgi:AraC-like DNA-binding protein/uncharacterized damage-inducible protein DinB